MSTLQVLRGRMTQSPFEPFRVVMESGQAFDVFNREMGFLTKACLVVGVDEVDGIPAEFKMCALPQIVKIESLHAGEAVGRPAQPSLHDAA